MVYSNINLNKSAKIVMIDRDDDAIFMVERTTNAVLLELDQLWEMVMCASSHVQRTKYNRYSRARGVHVMARQQIQVIMNQMQHSIQSLVFPISQQICSSLNFY